MKLTIGMACYNDYSGAWATVNNLRHNHDLHDCEILVVDNAPKSNQTKELKLMVEALSECKGRYVLYNEITGAANAKNAVVENAQGEFVLVIDSHVFLQRDSIKRLKQFYDANRTTDDLYHGPIVTHSTLPYSRATHLWPEWGSGLYGKWATAWRTDTGRYVSTHNDGNKLLVADLLTNESIDMGGREFSGHERYLESIGWRLAIESDEPFEIPAQGMAIFSCRRESWLGFNPLFREFGGEEYYMQNKYRHHGRKVWCLPWMYCHHQFYNEKKRTYPNRLASKFRNFVIGRQEFGMGVDDVVEHFGSLGLAKDEMQSIIEHPAKIIAHTADMLLPVGEPIESRNDLFNSLLHKPSSINDHGKYLRWLAKKCQHVTEVSQNPESAVFLFAGDPVDLVSYVPKPDPIFDVNRKLFVEENYHDVPITHHLFMGDIDSPCKIQPTDMLFINAEPTYERVAAELSMNASRVQYHILVAGTHKYGATGVDGGLGLKQAIEEFLAANSDWFVLYSSNKGDGIVALSREGSLKPPIPKHPWGVSCGVGAELERIFGWFRIKPIAGCKCKAVKEKMDALGVDWCANNIPVIIDWLKEEHHRRKMWTPFSEFIAIRLVRWAIRRAKRKIQRGECD